MLFILHLTFSRIYPIKMQTVAMNSTDQAMLTVMIINNFTEIKGSVFKKFDKHNLFQLACSDVTERFELFLFMMIIIFVGLAQAGDAWFEMMPYYIQVVITMITCEAFADWIKHAFIIKTNQLDPALYADYACVLRSDVLNYQADKIVPERTYGIARRVGFPQIPLACVCYRYVNLMISTPSVSKYFHGLSAPYIGGIFFIVYFILFVVKINIGLSLIFFAGKIHNNEMQESEQQEILGDKRTPNLSPTMCGTQEGEIKSNTTKSSVSHLADIERYTSLNDG